MLASTKSILYSTYALSPILVKENAVLGFNAFGPVALSSNTGTVALTVATIVNKASAPV